MQILGISKGYIMFTIKKYKSLYRLLLNNGFKESDCTSENLRNLWRKDLQLNRYKLEIAGQEQSTIFEKWNNLNEDISGLLEDENRVLRKVRSTLDLQIRSCPKRVLKAKYGFPDLKESAIKSIIDLNPKVEKQEKKVIFLRTLNTKLRGVVKAAEHRRSNIRILTDLYVSSYYNCSVGRGKHSEKRRKGK